MIDEPEPGSYEVPALRLPPEQAPLRAVERVVHAELVTHLVGQVVDRRRSRRRARGCRCSPSPCCWRRPRRGRRRRRRSGRPRRARCRSSRRRSAGRARSGCARACRRCRTPSWFCVKQAAVPQGPLGSKACGRGVEVEQVVVVDQVHPVGELVLVDLVGAGHQDDLAGRHVARPPVGGEGGVAEQRQPVDAQRLAAALAGPGGPEGAGRWTSGHARRRGCACSAGCGRSSSRTRSG